MIDKIGSVLNQPRDPQPITASANMAGEVQKMIKPENKIMDDAVSKNEESKDVGNVECETCKSRRYVDGSNDPHVSFKTPGYISPEASASVVAAHEQEHVSEAISEGNKEGNKLLSVSVQLHTAVCPECGRVYVAGGTTKSSVAYSNPNVKNDDSYKEGLKGLKVDGTA